MDTTYQLNPLVNAQKNFSVMETRLFYLGLRAINPHITANDKYFDENFPDTIISPSELKKIFGHGQYLAEIKKACKRLIGSSIEINYKRVSTCIQFFSISSIRKIKAYTSNSAKK